MDIDNTIFTNGSTLNYQADDVDTSNIINKNLYMHTIDNSDFYRYANKL